MLLKLVMQQVLGCLLLKKEEVEQDHQVVVAEVDHQVQEVAGEQDLQVVEEDKHRLVQEVVAGLFLILEVLEEPLMELVEEECRFLVHIE